jgi:hypothetical protein
MLVAGTANICASITLSRPKLRNYASFMYQAGNWKRPRKVVAHSSVAVAGRRDRHAPSGIGDLSQGLAFVTLLPDSCRPFAQLDTRAGFLSPSLDGGLPRFRCSTEAAIESKIRLSGAFSALNTSIS